MFCRPASPRRLGFSRRHGAAASICRRRSAPTITVKAPIGDRPAQIVSDNFIVVASFKLMKTMQAEVAHGVITCIIRRASRMSLCKSGTRPPMQTIVSERFGSWIGAKMLGHHVRRQKQQRAHQRRGRQGDRGLSGRRRAPASAIKEIRPGGGGDGGGRVTQEQHRHNRLLRRSRLARRISRPFPSCSRLPISLSARPPAR